MSGEAWARIPLPVVDAFFRPPNLRVQIDADRTGSLLAASVGICTHVTTDGFADWYTPWYSDDADDEVSHDDPSAKPMRLRDAVANESLVKRRKLDQWASRLSAGSRSIQVIATTVQFRAGSRLVLDGNHRLAALLLLTDTVPVAVLELCLDAQSAIELDIPDLRHHLD